MTFKELIVWQKSMDLVDEVYALTKIFPKMEMYALTNQVRRAVVSVPSNIAEGFKRNTEMDFARFLSISAGSCAEVETQIYIAIRQKMINEEQAEIALSLCDEIGRMLGSMIGKIKNNNK